MFSKISAGIISVKELGVYVTPVFNKAVFTKSYARGLVFPYSNKVEKSLVNPSLSILSVGFLRRFIVVTKPFERAGNTDNKFGTNMLFGTSIFFSCKENCRFLSLDPIVFFCSGFNNSLSI